MSQDAERLTALISPLRRALLAAATTRASLPDLPDAQIEVLRVLLKEGPHAPSSVAAELGLGRSTVSNLLAAMERRGLVTRTQRADDRRRVGLAASASATALFSRYDQASSTIVGEALSALPHADRAALGAALPALEHLRDSLVAISRDARATASSRAASA